MKQEIQAISRRSGSVDVQKFFYSWIICLFHFWMDVGREHLQGASAAVEFFVLTSGVFFFRGWFKKREGILAEGGLSYPVNYSVKRIRRFLPLTIIGCTLALAIRCFALPALKGTKIGIGYIVDQIVRRIWDYSLLTMNGMQGGAAPVDTVLWTISAMILMEFLILCFLVTKEKLYTNILLPASILAGYGWYGYMPKLDVFRAYGLLRVYLLIGLAYYICLAVDRVSQMEFSRRGIWILTVIELGCHILFVVLVEHRNTRYIRWFSTALFMIGLIITFSGKSYWSKLLRQTKLTDFLGEWSAAIYFTHRPIQFMLQGIISAEQYKQELRLVIGITIAVSLATVWGARQLEKGLQRLAPGIKRLMLCGE